MAVETFASVTRLVTGERAASAYYYKKQLAAVKVCTDDYSVVKGAPSSS